MNTGKKNIFIILLFVSIIVIVLLFSVKAYKLQPNKEKQSVDEDNNITVAEEKAKESSNLDDPDLHEYEENIIAGYGNISVKSDGKTAEVSFVNPKENEGLLSLRYEIILKTDRSPIFISDLLEAGNEIKQIELSRILKHGDYDALIRITPVMADNPNQTFQTMIYSATVHVE